MLDGSAGDMTLTAGNKGTQWLVGADGDTLIGKSSNDTFLFPPNFGNETVNGFNTKHDVIDLPKANLPISLRSRPTYMPRVTTLS